MNSPVYRVSAGGEATVQLTLTYLIPIYYFYLISRNFAAEVAAWLLYYLVNNLDIFPRKVEKYEY